MTDLLNIGSSALFAAQKGLDLTGHNIANVGTDGYSRQRVDQAAIPGGTVSRFDSGGGVTINGTQRINDALLESRLVRDGSEVARLDAFSSIAGRADSLLSGSSSGLATPLNGFFSGLQQIAADPASTATRQAALGDAAALVDRFNSLHVELSGIDAEIDQRLTQAVATVNDLAGNIARLNRSIALAGQNVPADLIDQRNTLIQKLSEQVGVTTLAQDDGALNVFTSSGQPLVVGEKVSPLGTVDDLYRPGRVDITSGTARVTGQLSGGLIGGLLDARRSLVDPALEKLGRLAVGLSSSINAAQAGGITQDGNVGTALFSAPSGTVFAASSNSGTATLQAGFGDLSQLTGDDYLLRNTGTGWQLTRARSGEAVSFTGTGTAIDPFVFEGVTVAVAGAAASGDSFRVSPTHDAADGLALVTSDPRHFAAASRLSGSASLSNTGAAKLSGVTVLDAGNAQLTTPATITFTSATSYQIGAGPSIAFAAGDSISANGWSVTLSGTPKAGDSFSINPTPLGSTDNSNARALAAVAQTKLFDGGRSSLANANAALVTQTGAITQQVSSAQAAAEAVRVQSQSERDAISGVNLDEEAANLVRYQQAYQAAAQVIATVSTLFDTLLAATRR